MVNTQAFHIKRFQVALEENAQAFSSRVLIKLALVVTHKLVFSNSLEAVPGFSVAMADAMPHQLVNRLCGQVLPSLSPGATGISLIQGMDVTPDGFELMLKLVVQARCRVFHSVGANFADEIALKRFNPNAEPTGAQWLLSSCVFCFLAKAQVAP